MGRPFKADDDILRWLNKRKQQLLAGKECPISDAIHVKNDELKGGGNIFEGYPVVCIQFHDVDGLGIASTDPDERKNAAVIQLDNQPVRILWVRTGCEHLLESIEHDNRLFEVTAS